MGDVLDCKRKRKSKNIPHKWYQYHALSCNSGVAVNCICKTDGSSRTDSKADKCCPNTGGNDPWQARVGSKAIHQQTSGIQERGHKQQPESNLRLHNAFIPSGAPQDVPVAERPTPHHSKYGTDESGDIGIADRNDVKL